MAIISYRGIPIACGMSEQAHTLHVEEKAQFDDTGTDYRDTEVTIDALGTIHPQALATVAGNTAGKTLQQLATLALGQPRGLLVFQVSNDRVIESPILLPNGQRAATDARNGPVVEAVQVVQIMGDKTILIHFRVKTWIRDGKNVLLYNRWQIHSHLDALHYETRTVKGVAALRGDLARDPANPLGIDQMRRSLFIPCPRGYQRGPIDVTVSEDGLQLTYEFQDAEQALNKVPGQGKEKFPGVLIEGSCTNGYETDLNKAIDQVERTAPRSIWESLSLNPWRTGQGIGAAIRGAGLHLFVSSLPRYQSNAIVRVTGDKVASKIDLGFIALQVILDRFSLFAQPGVPGFNLPFPLLPGVNIPLPDLDAWVKFAMPVSCYLTQDVMQRWVELRMEFVPLMINPKAILSPGGRAGVITGGGFMKLSSDINLGDAGQLLTVAPANTPNPQFPRGTNTRGFLTPALIVAAFNPPGAAPPDAPDAGETVDTQIR